jgi:hypothetical protein
MVRVYILHSFRKLVNTPVNYRLKCAQVVLLVTFNYRYLHVVERAGHLTQASPELTNLMHCSLKDVPSFCVQYMCTFCRVSFTYECLASGFLLVSKASLRLLNQQYRVVDASCIKCGHNSANTRILTSSV